MDVKVLNSQVLLFISICCMFQMNTYDEMLWSSIEYGEHEMSLLKNMFKMFLLLLVLWTNKNLIKN
jgi:hypothetical protein